MTTPDLLGVTLADGGDELVVERLAAARKAARAQVWAAGRASPVVVQARGAAADPTVDASVEPLAIDIDATLVTAHSDDKDDAAPTYKRGFGFHPLLAYLDRGDGLGESLAGLLRPGNAGAKNRDGPYRRVRGRHRSARRLPDGLRLIVRVDSAGATREFLAYLRDAGVGFSVSLRAAPPRSTPRSAPPTPTHPLEHRDPPERRPA